jgi:hypothetical protein
MRRVPAGGLYEECTVAYVWSDVRRRRPIGEMAMD